MRDDGTDLAAVEIAGFRWKKRPEIHWGYVVKKIGFRLPGIRARVQSHRRFVHSAVVFSLMASLVVSPDAEPMVMGAVVPPFESEIVDQWGGMQRPSRIAVRENGRIYVSDSGQGVVAIFDSDGKRIGTLTGVDAPLGLAVSGLNRCIDFLGCSCPWVSTAYVGDEFEGSVSVFENGRFARMLGAGPGEFIKPNGIAVTREQVAYVVDSEARNVKIFAPDGRLKSSLGSTSWDWYPIDIALNEAARELYVADHRNGSVTVFDFDGVWLRNLLAPNNDQGDPAFYRIAGIGIGPSGNLFVVDSALASVTILTPDGALVDIIGYQLGSYWTGELDVPIDAATRGNSLYVTSSKDRLVKVFEVAQ
jgi:DNA-binding beta-propeller fold protein YncE